MELKFSSGCPCTSGLFVQIVPLWNWNPITMLFGDFERSSNCTFMELKYLTPLRFPSGRGANCTFMELKYLTPLRFPSGRGQIVPLWNWNIIITSGYRCSACSNCTFMELKWNNHKKIIRTCKVQIVPLWNWNYFLLVFSSSSVPFKLYLYGIEITEQ